MKLNQDLEEELKSRVMMYLEKGKPAWDIPHTLASVYWMKRLIEKEGGNEKILVSVMYLHDIGYSGLFKKEYEFGEVMASKPLHMKRGAEMSEIILTELGYSSLDIEQIVHLVKVHDELEKLSSHDEILVMEADCLGQIDTDRIKSTLSKKGNSEFISHFEKERVPRFKTDSGKTFLNELLVKAKKYYQDYYNCKPHYFSLCFPLKSKISKADKNI